DKQRVDVLLNATTRRDVEGNIVGVIGVGQDITAVKRLQMETERSAAELTQLIDTANAPIFGIDTEGRVNEWNQTAARISGFDKAQVMGRELVADFITEEYKLSVKEVFETALGGKDTANFEFPLYTKDKQRVDVLLNATTRRDVEGNIVGVIGVGQDITLLKQKESALQQAQKMEAVGQLTGGIAHDFNNLLSIVQGNLRFLEEDIGEVSDDIKLLFRDALSAVEDGAELTARLLRFSSNRDLQPVTKEVNVAIEDFYRLVIRTIGDKISLDLKLTEEKLFVQVDPSQLENSLLNLVINARDAMPEGGEVIIMAEAISYAEATRIAGQYDADEFHNQEFVKISVRDQGTGIPQDIINQVIDPFYTTKEVGAGTGLGLSMVYSFVKTSGGFLRINSEVGEGTVVEMYFPSTPKPKNALREEDVATSRQSSLSKTILVVEDEPRVRRVAVRTLRGLNYNTIEAENADMAISIIESGKEIDLVFSDILMPGDKDGRMLGDWVTERYPEMKVVLTSGYSKGKADERDPLHSENLTKYPIVRKPYRLNALADIIQGEWGDN
ncbi:MAG: PAS domain S-box-containing protein, partial [Candidatus Azotimanducaceae bacterium]